MFVFKHTTLRNSSLLHSLLNVKINHSDFIQKHQNKFAFNSRVDKKIQRLLSEEVKQYILDAKDYYPLRSVKNIRHAFYFNNKINLNSFSM